MWKKKEWLMNWDLIPAGTCLDGHIRKSEGQSNSMAVDRTVESAAPYM
jgi:hypothetical protein